MKTQNRGIPIDSNQHPSIQLFVENVFRITDGYWTDKTGKIIAFASTDPHDQFYVKLHALHFTIHGQKFLPDQKRILRNWNPNNNNNNNNNNGNGKKMFLFYFLFI